jgi:hypothetical protein
MALSGASEDEPQAPGAPRPADGPSQEGRADLQQGLLRLGVSGAGGVPLRVGGRDGHRRARVATPCASEAGLRLGREAVQGIVGDGQASRRRTWGLGREPGLG